MLRKHLDGVEKFMFYSAFFFSNLCAFREALDNISRIRNKFLQDCVLFLLKLYASEHVALRRVVHVWGSNLINP